MWALPFLMRAKVITGTDAEIALVKSALPIIQERITRLSEVPAMLKFLFATNFSVEAESYQRSLTPHLKMSSRDPLPSSRR